MSQGQKEHPSKHRYNISEQVHQGIKTQDLIHYNLCKTRFVC